MKHLLTLFWASAFVWGYSQSVNKAMDFAPMDHKTTFQSPTMKPYHHSTERSASIDFFMDYGGFDELYSTNNGYDYISNIGQEINANYGNDANLTTKYVAVKFDTLMYQDQNTGNISFYPRSQSTLTLDSFDILFIHSNTSGNPDTIHYTVFNTDQASVIGYGSPNAVFTTPAIWDTVIITNTSLSANPQQFDLATFYPNISLPQGKSFGIRVDFAGDTADKFYVAAGYRDECLNACVAEIAYVGNNAAYYLNLTTSTGDNLSGYFENDGQGAIYYDCDQSGGFTNGGCENFFIQNIRIIPYVTANINYGATIVADSLKGCPNTQLNLTANAFGSTDEPYQYSWSTSSGNLTSTSDQQVSLILGSSNATVTVTVTDANNQTTTASVVVQSKGINVSITNPNPLEINCGGSGATVFTSISGVTSGKYYTWSTGAAGATQASIPVNTPGNYTVTVTNNSGCSATASLTVQYPGGIANSVSFGPIPNPVCQGKEFTLPNTSSNKTGWSATWDFGDSNLGFSLDGVHTYNNPGVFPVTLSMDSAGCTFTSNAQNVTVLAASNSACLSGIEDVTFSNAISVLPNPSKGNVTITVNAAEKNLTVRVYNIIGSEVMNYNTTTSGATFTKTFDMSGLSNGTYLVKISSGDKVAVKRMTIAK